MPVSALLLNQSHPLLRYFITQLGTADKTGKQRRMRHTGKPGVSQQTGAAIERATPSVIVHNLY